MSERGVPTSVFQRLGHIIQAPYRCCILLSVTPVYPGWDHRRLTKARLSKRRVVGMRSLYFDFGPTMIKGEWGRVDLGTIPWGHMVASINRGTPR